MEQQPILFKEFATEEFLPWSKVDHSTNHHNHQKVVLEAHLIPYFEGRHLHEITAKRIEDYKAMRAKKVNRATVNREVSCLKKLFRKAVEWGQLEVNPVQDVKAFKETPKKPRLLEVEEVAILLEKCREESCPVDLYALVCCIVYAGLRKAEVFNLRWDGIDWKREELTLRSRPEWHTKNYGNRTIPMNNVLVAALRGVREGALRRGGKALRSSLVFPTPEGTAYKNVHYIKAALDKAAEKARIKDGVTFHQLRHAFCSHAQMQGVDALTVQRWMGHKDLRTTLRYSHTSSAHEKAAMKQLQYNSADREKEAG